MTGPCARVRVFCTIISPNGNTYTGENVCEIPQDICPRVSGEDYTKCNTICRTKGHAEIVALSLAGEDSRGALAIVEKHKPTVCQPCQKALMVAGIRQVVVVSQRQENIREIQIDFSGKSEAVA